MQQEKTYIHAYLLWYKLEKKTVKYEKDLNSKMKCERSESRNYENSTSIQSKSVGIPSPRQLDVHEKGLISNQYNWQSKLISYFIFWYDVTFVIMNMFKRTHEMHSRNLT